MAVDINSGDLRHKIEILEATISQNDEGGREKVYSTFLTTWAALRNVSNFRVSDPSAFIDTKEFFIRYTPTRVLTVDHLLVYNGQQYQVAGVQLVEEKQRFIKLTCKKRDPNG